jgi:hypothetical protein
MLRRQPLGGEVCSQVYPVDLAFYPSNPNDDRIGSTEFTSAFIDESNQATQKAKEVVQSRLRFEALRGGRLPDPG